MYARWPTATRVRSRSTGVSNGTRETLPMLTADLLPESYAEAARPLRACISGGAARFAAGYQSSGSTDRAGANSLQRLLHFCFPQITAR